MDGIFKLKTKKNATNTFFVNSLWLTSPIYMLPDDLREKLRSKAREREQAIFSSKTRFARNPTEKAIVISSERIVTSGLNVAIDTPRDCVAFEIYEFCSFPIAVYVVQGRRFGLPDEYYEWLLAEAKRKPNLSIEVPRIVSETIERTCVRRDGLTFVERRGRNRDKKYEQKPNEDFISLAIERPFSVIVFHTIDQKVLARANYNDPTEKDERLLKKMLKLSIPKIGQGNLFQKVLTYFKKFEDLPLPTALSPKSDAKLRKMMPGGDRRNVQAVLKEILNEKSVVPHQSPTALHPVLLEVPKELREMDDKSESSDSYLCSEEENHDELENAEEGNDDEPTLCPAETNSTLEVPDQESKNGEFENVNDGAQADDSEVTLDSNVQDQPTAPDGNNDRSNALEHNAESEITEAIVGVTGQSEEPKSTAADVSEKIDDPTFKDADDRKDEEPKSSDKDRNSDGEVKLEERPFSPATVDSGFVENHTESISIPLNSANLEIQDPAPVEHVDEVSLPSIAENTDGEGESQTSTTDNVETEEAEEIKPSAPELEIVRNDDWNHQPEPFVVTEDLVSQIVSHPADPDPVEQETTAVAPETEPSKEEGVNDQLESSAAIMETDDLVSQIFLYPVDPDPVEQEEAIAIAPETDTSQEENFNDQLELAGTVEDLVSQTLSNPADPDFLEQEETVPVASETQEESLNDPLEPLAAAAVVIDDLISQVVLNSVDSDLLDEEEAVPVTPENDPSQEEGLNDQLESSAAVVETDDLISQVVSNPVDEEEAMPVASEPDPSEEVGINDQLESSVAAVSTDEIVSQTVSNTVDPDLLEEEEAISVAPESDISQDGSFNDQQEYSAASEDLAPDDALTELDLLEQILPFAPKLEIVQDDSLVCQPDSSMITADLTPANDSSPIDPEFDGNADSSVVQESEDHKTTSEDVIQQGFDDLVEPEPIDQQDPATHSQPTETNECDISTETISEDQPVPLLTKEDSIVDPESASIPVDPEHCDETGEIEQLITETEKEMEVSLADEIVPNDANTCSIPDPETSVVTNEVQQSESLPSDASDDVSEIEKAASLPSVPSETEGDVAPVLEVDSEIEKLEVIEVKEQDETIGGTENLSIETPVCQDVESQIQEAAVEELNFSDPDTVTYPQTSTQELDVDYNSTPPACSVADEEDEASSTDSPVASNPEIDDLLSVEPERNEELHLNAHVENPMDCDSKTTDDAELGETVCVEQKDDEATPIDEPNVEPAEPQSQNEPETDIHLMESNLEDQLVASPATVDLDSVDYLANDDLPEVEKATSDEPDETTDKEPASHPPGSTDKDEHLETILNDEPASPATKESEFVENKDTTRETTLVEPHQPIEELPSRSNSETLVEVEECDDQPKPNEPSTCLESTIENDLPEENQLKDHLLPAAENSNSDVESALNSEGSANAEDPASQGINRPAIVEEQQVAESHMDVESQPIIPDLKDNSDNSTTSGDVDKADEISQLLPHSTTTSENDAGQNDDHQHYPFCLPNSHLESNQNVAIVDDHTLSRGCPNQLDDDVTAVEFYDGDELPLVCPGCGGPRLEPIIISIKLNQPAVCCPESNNQRPAPMTRRDSVSNVPTPAPDVQVVLKTEKLYHNTTPQQQAQESGQVRRPRTRTRWEADVVVPNSSAAVVLEFEFDDEGEMRHKILHEGTTEWWVLSVDKTDCYQEADSMEMDDSTDRESNEALDPSEVIRQRFREASYDDDKETEDNAEDAKDLDEKHCLINSETQTDCEIEVKNQEPTEEESNPTNYDGVEENTEEEVHPSDPSEEQEETLIQDTLAETPAACESNEAMDERPQTDDEPEAPAEVVIETMANIDEEEPQPEPSDHLKDSETQTQQVSNETQPEPSHHLKDNETQTQQVTNDEKEMIETKPSEIPAVTASEMDDNLVRPTEESKEETPEETKISEPTSNLHSEEPEHIETSVPVENQHETRLSEPIAVVTDLDRVENLVHQTGDDLKELPEEIEREEVDMEKPEAIKQVEPIPEKIQPAAGDIVVQPAVECIKETPEKSRQPSRSSDAVVNELPDRVAKKRPRIVEFETDSEPEQATTQNEKGNPAKNKRTFDGDEEVTSAASEPLPPPPLPGTSRCVNRMAERAAGEEVASEGAVHGSHDTRWSFAYRSTYHACVDCRPISQYHSAYVTREPRRQQNASWHSKPAAPSSPWPVVRSPRTRR